MAGTKLSFTERFAQLFFFFHCLLLKKAFIDLNCGILGNFMLLAAQRMGLLPENSWVFSPFQF